jgi:hypothetical protein
VLPIGSSDNAGCVARQAREHSTRGMPTLCVLYAGCGTRDRVVSTISFCSFDVLATLWRLWHVDLKMSYTRLMFLLLSVPFGLIQAHTDLFFTAP